MAKVMVIAESGFGKSTSICPSEELGIKGLNPNETFVINVNIGKDLPSRGWKKLYKHITDRNPASGNYLESNSGIDIAGLISVLQEKNPSIKNLVIDDLQYLMADYYMLKAKTAGFDKFQDIGYFMGQIFTAMNKFKGNIFCLTHPEETTSGGYKAKTVGKMVDSYLTMEGKFDIIFYGQQEYDSKTKKTIKNFITNFDGKYNAKSPVGMFKDLLIPNDLGLALESIQAYYEGE